MALTQKQQSDARISVYATAGRAKATPTTGSASAGRRCLPAPVPLLGRRLLARRHHKAASARFRPALETFYRMRYALTITRFRQPRMPISEIFLGSGLCRGRQGAAPRLGGTARRWCPPPLGDTHHPHTIPHRPHTIPICHTISSQRLVRPPAPSSAMRMVPSDSMSFMTCCSRALLTAVSRASCSCANCLGA